MAKFGILGDIFGQQDDYPTLKLPAGYACGESEWVHYWHGVIQRLLGRTKEFCDAGGAKVRTPDNNPIIRWHYHVTSAGIEYELAFTKAHVYRWVTATKEWDLLWTCGSDCVRWSTADFGKYVVATNNIDKVITWDDTTPGTDFALLGGASGIDCGGGIYLTKAEYVIECENYVILMGTTEGGTYRAYRRRWCTWSDITDWLSTGGSGDAGFNDLEANKRIMGCGVYTAGGLTRLITFTQNSQDAMWLTTEDIVWQSETILGGVGCASPGSIVNDALGNLYYLATDQTIRRVYATEVVGVSGDIDKTLRNLHPAKLKFMAAVYVPTINEIWWAVPSGPTSTGNDLVLALCLSTMTWFKEPMAIAAFGFWRGQMTYTINTMPGATIDTVPWPTIDWAGAVAEFPFLIASDYSGYGYSCLTDDLDMGAAYRGRLVLATDLAASQAVTEFKRLHGVWVYFLPAHQQNMQATVSIMTDSDPNYVTVGTVNLYTDAPQVTEWLPCDQLNLRFRTCKFKVEATNDFAFIGVVFDFDFDGDT